MARREMKQTLLTFGGKVAKCTGVHEKLQTIRSCKQCYTISSLRRRCTSTISFKTGQPLGKYGTKNQLLARLIENAELHKNNGKFVCVLLLLNTISCFVLQKKINPRTLVMQRTRSAAHLYTVSLCALLL